MGRRGRMPAGDSPRTKYAWQNVPDVPYEDGPDLPEGDWPDATRRWWRGVSRMPHAVLWAESDWGFALDTALLHAAFSKGDIRLGTELRNREQVLGTTFAARQRAQIVYVPVEPERTEVAPVLALVDEYQRLYY